MSRANARSELHGNKLVQQTEHLKFQQSHFICGIHKAQGANQNKERERQSTSSRIEYHLTDEERKFAEENHNLIYSFLQKYNLPADDWYDVIALGYLNAVRNWFNREDLHKYSFATIAFKAMYGTRGTTMRGIMRSRNNSVTLVSLQQPMDDEGTLTLEDVIQGSMCLEDECESSVQIQLNYSKLSKTCKDILKEYAAGYSQNQIADKHHLSQAQISRKLNRIKYILKESYEKC